MPYAPALLLLLFTAWVGTFEGAASAAGAMVAVAALLLALVWAGLRLDPLGLGREGRYLVGGLLVAVAISAWTSPVTRAGLEGLLLLPAWLTLPVAVALCWRRAEDRRRGLLAVAGVVAVVSLWALADWIFTSTPRPSRPLGHHNFLALWLVTLLPVVALTTRGGRGSRWLGVTTLALGLGTLLATRSLAGLAALLVSAAGLGIWLLGRGSRARRLGMFSLVVLGIVVVGLGAPRALDVLGGRDSSFEARQVYLRAGTEGTLVRPLTGWGPGSTPWTLALFLEPRPGVNPPSEVVGQLHALPLQVAYEIGIPGCLLMLAILVVFTLRGWHGARTEEARWTVVAALCGLGAAAVASSSTSALGVTALPVAWVVAAGVVLSVSASPETLKVPSRARTVALVAAALILVALLPWLRARLLYERAAEATELETAEQRLAVAVKLDPAFPLYRARWAWTTGSAADARRAAADAVGVAPLWIQAGVLALESGEGWTRDALLRACRLDPFSPFAPWFLARSDPTEPDTPRRVARALLLEPRLIAALWLVDKPELRAMAAREIARWPGVDPGLREALRSTLDAVGDTRPGDAVGVDEVVAALVLTLEARPDQPFALHAFRRLSWPARLAAVPVRTATARSVELPSAARRPETTETAFGTLRGCR